MCAPRPGSVQPLRQPANGSDPFGSLRATHWAGQNAAGRMVCKAECGLRAPDLGTPRSLPPKMNRTLPTHERPENRSGPCGVYSLEAQGQRLGLLTKHPVRGSARAWEGEFLRWKLKAFSRFHGLFQGPCGQGETTGNNTNSQGCLRGGHLAKNAAKHDGNILRA